MAHEYLVISDLHLADVEDHDDGWKYYKSSRYVPDEALAELIAEFAAPEQGEQEGGGGDDGPGSGAGDGLTPRTLILNGDVLDFDLVTCVPAGVPFRVSRSERHRCLRASEDRSLWKLRRILQDHEGFLVALARFLAAGHRVVYVIGNHDRELHFPTVRERFVRAVRDVGEDQGFDTAGWTIRFEPWFYYVPGEIYAEHGQQYDHYTSFRHLLDPTVRLRGRRELALPMGNMSNRYLMTRMGYFNPHASDFILNLGRYFTHWLRHYAFTRRSLVGPWFLGSLFVLARLLRNKRKQLRPPPGYESRVRDLAKRFGLNDVQMRTLRRQQLAPITYRVYRMLREFWIDRMIIAAGMILGTVVLALLPVPLWMKLMVPFSTFPLAFLLYEHVARGEGIFAIERELPRRATTIGQLLRVPVVTFGHTHVPRLLPLTDRLTFVDTGTWAPVTGRMGDGDLLPGLRNYLWVRAGDGPPQIALRSWPV